MPRPLLLNGSGAIYQTAASMSESIPLILTLYLLPMVSLKVQSCCHYCFAFTWMTYHRQRPRAKLSLFLSFQLSDIDQSILKLEQDRLRTAQWLCENHLLINPDKTKFLLLGTRQMLSRLPEDLSMSFLGKKVKPSESAKDLGVLLDPHLTMIITSQA